MTGLILTVSVAWASAMILRATAPQQEVAEEEMPL